MKAVVAHELGPPEAFKLIDAPQPEPQKGQIRVGVRAAGVSFVDVLIATGRYQVKPPLPYIPGSEFSGQVEALGPGVTGFRIGDRVMGTARGGVFAEQLVVSTDSVLPIPPGMPFAGAAVGLVSYATALYALVQRGNLTSGETVLILGAAGAVGLAAVQIAKALGGRVIASASTEEKRAIARAAGADAVLDSKALDWRDRVKSLTQGRGVNIVIDPVGAGATERAFRSLAWNGRHLVIGYAAGAIPQLPVNLALLKGAALVGVDVRQFEEREPDAYAANMKMLLRMRMGGGLRPVIFQRFPLADFAAAMQTAALGRAAGRIVLEMDMARRDAR